MALKRNPARCEQSKKGDFLRKCLWALGILVLWVLKRDFYVRGVKIEAGQLTTDQSHAGSFGVDRNLKPTKL